MLVTLHCAIETETVSDKSTESKKKENTKNKSTENKKTVSFMDQAVGADKKAMVKDISGATHR